MGRPLRKLTLGRPIRRWECDIKMDMKGVSCEDGRWMELVVRTVSEQTFYINNAESLNCVTEVGFYLKTSFVLKTKEYSYASSFSKVMSMTRRSIGWVFIMQVSGIHF
jgi:hypothetical protein